MGPTHVSLCGLWTCVPIYVEWELVGPVCCSYEECGLVGPSYMCVPMRNVDLWVLMCVPMRNMDLWVQYMCSYVECGLVGPVYVFLCGMWTCGSSSYMCSYEECGLVGPVCVLLCGAGTCGPYKCSSVQCGA